jgi:hypothetical protein
VETVEGKRHRARERRKNHAVMKRRIRRMLMQGGSSLQRQVTHADRRNVTPSQTQSMNFTILSNSSSSSVSLVHDEYPVHPFLSEFINVILLSEVSSYTIFSLVNIMCCIHFRQNEMHYRVSPPPISCEANMLDHVRFFLSMFMEAEDFL